MVSTWLTDLDELFHQALSGLCGGRVLDVACGLGGFVGILMANLKSYDQIIGIDTDGRAIQTARTSFNQRNVRFLQMGAERLGFGEESFDTANISASLHHLADAPRVLAEMKRVLKPGGHFIVSEMHRDGQNAAQSNMIEMHHWVADIDSALGNLHRRTLGRQEIIELVQEVGLKHVTLFDFVDADSDPSDVRRIQTLKEGIGRHLERAQGVNGYNVLKKQGDALRQRLSSTGVQREPVIVIVGTKP